jgi:hypothetical protein
MSKCEYCLLGRRVRRTVKSGSRKQFEKLADELMNLYTQESEDNSYHKAILDGSWPSAIPQLEHALREAREVHLTKSDEEREYIEKMYSYASFPVSSPASSNSINATSGDDARKG